jgi:cysteine desulfurase
VISALGIQETYAMGTLRFSLGRWTTAEEIDTVLMVLPTILSTTRRSAARRR